MTERRLELRAGAATDVGRARSVNQDALLLRPEQGLWMVADGMGGAQGGEVASAMAVEIVGEAYQERSVDALLAAVEEANRRIHDAAIDQDLRGMGTTAVLLAQVPAPPTPELDDDGEPTGELADPADLPDQLVVLNVGDSRAYLFRDGELVQLTEDHSVVGEMVRDGRLTRQEADVHPHRNVVTRVLGPYAHIEADVWPVDAIRGDRIVLCSDGLSGEVREAQIAAVLRRLEDPTEAAQELVRLANEAGGRDNITVVVVDVIDDGGVTETASEALAARRSHLQSRDLAGFSTALSEDELAEDEPRGAGGAAGSRRARRAERKAQRTSRSRLTWRVVAFVVLLAAVLGGAFATIQWYGTSAYFVGFDGDEVAIYQGRPGGVLWIQPELKDGTGIMRDEVPDRYLADLEAGREHSSMAQAQRYVSNIERDIQEEAREQATTTTTTSTTAPPPTTAAPG